MSNAESRERLFIHQEGSPPATVLRKLGQLLNIDFALKIFVFMFILKVSNCQMSVIFS